MTNLFRRPFSITLQRVVHHICDAVKVEGLPGGGRVLNFVEKPANHVGPGEESDNPNGHHERHGDGDETPENLTKVGRKLEVGVTGDAKDGISTPRSVPAGAVRVT